MDIKKIEDAITNGFSKFFGNALPKDAKLPDNAAKDFATEIANALKGELITEEKITEMINAATEGDAEELGKVFVNKTEMDALKNEIINNLGGKTDTSTEKTKTENKTSGGKKNNRFAGRTFFNADQKA